MPEPDIFIVKIFPNGGRNVEEYFFRTKEAAHKFCGELKDSDISVGMDGFAFVEEHWFEDE